MDPALITGATAVLTGGVGYLSALLQHKGERGRLALEESRLEYEYDARLDGQEKEAIESRRDLYLGYVDLFDAAWHLCHDQGVMEVSLVDEWWSRYQAAQQRMALLAAGPVAKAMNVMRPLVSELAYGLEVAIRGQVTDADAQAFARRAVWSEHAENLQGTQRYIEAKMREDLGTPD